MKTLRNSFLRLKRKLTNRRITQAAVDALQECVGKTVKKILRRVRKAVVRKTVMSFHIKDVVDSMWPHSHAHGHARSDARSHDHTTGIELTHNATVVLARFKSFKSGSEYQTPHCSNRNANLNLDEKTPAKRGRKTKQRISRETRAGLLFAISYFERAIRSQTKLRVSAGAPIFLTSIMEQIVTKWFDRILHVEAHRDVKPNRLITESDVRNIFDSSVFL